jgi:hypothetical protein
MNSPRTLHVLTLGLFSVTQSLHAQVEFTAANAVPPFGLQTCMVTQSVIADSSFPLSGEGVHWDFSSLSWFELGPTWWYYHPASWTLYTEFFPTANICYWRTSQPGEQFYVYSEVRQDSMMFKGSAHYWEDNVSEWSSACASPTVWLRFPAGVGDEVYWPTYSCGGSTYTYRREILASGDLDLGDEFFEDVLLFRTTTTNNGVSSVSYNWFALGDAYDPVLSYSDPSGSTIRRSCGSSATGVEPLSTKRRSMLAPNPASDRLQVMRTDGSPVNGSISIFDMQGRIVLAHTTLDVGQGSISVQDLPNGVYTAVITDGDMVYKDRFVVAH